MNHRTYPKLISLLFAWLFLLLGVHAPAERVCLAVQAETPAAGSYACILEENTFFYSAADERTGLFLLPKTYYVGVLEYGGEYCKVEYLYDDAQTKRLVGYAKTSLLTFVDYIPVRPYFSCSFELNYRIDEERLGSDFLTQITLSCTYYGDYKVGSKTYCYVLRGESFGYVPKPADLTFKENTEYEEYLQTLSSESAQPVAKEKEQSSSPVQIAILVALCLLVPVLAALILKPPRRPPYETEE